MLKLFAVCVALTLVSSCQGHMPSLDEFLEGLLEGDEARTTMAPMMDPNVVHYTIMVDRFQPYMGAACNEACRRMTSEFTQRIVSYNLYQMKTLSSKYSWPMYQFKFETKKYSIMDVVIVYVVSMDGAAGNMTTHMPTGTPGSPGPTTDRQGSPGPSTERPDTPSTAAPGSPSPTAPPASTTLGSAVDFDWTCSFETNWCGIQQSVTDNFNWTLNSGGTGSTGTGPSAAADGDNYIYIEASSPRNENDIAIIVLPSVSVAGRYCISFYYHMNGGHIGTLGLWTLSAGGSLDMQWSLSGRQQATANAPWTRASIIVDMQPGMAIAFSATVGNEYQGDISIDNIGITGDLSQCQ